MRYALIFLCLLFLCITGVSAVDYCVPNTVNATYTHEGNWFNFTFTNYECPFCVNTGVELDCTSNCVSAPTTTFASNATCGKIPFPVMFNDTSNANGDPITSWFWDFGDGNTSTTQNASHIYSYIGRFTVSHSATNSVGTGWSNRTNYITTGLNGTFCGNETAFDPSERVHYNQSFSIAYQPVNYQTDTLWLVTCLIGLGMLLLSTLARRLSRELTDVTSILSTVFLFLAAIWSFQVDTITSYGMSSMSTAEGREWVILTTHTIYHYEIWGVVFSILFVISAANIIVTWLEYRRIEESETEEEEEFTIGKVNNGKYN